MKSEVEVFIKDIAAPDGGYWVVHHRFTDVSEATKYGWVARLK